MTPQEEGIAFENKVQNSLEQSQKTIFREKHVKQYFGNDITAIDHLIISDNLCIAIQDKWQNKKPSVDQINHFILCVKNVKQKINKKIIGLYLSNLELSQPSQNAFDRNSTNNCNFVSIYSENQNILLHKLMKFLYLNGIFYYEDDGSTIMFEPNNYNMY
jgi:hypothetical protein